MSRDRYKKKLQYFLDYYLVKTVAICFGIFVVALFLVHYFRPAPETILYVAVYDLTLDGEEKDTLCRELAAAYEEGAEASQVIIDDSFRSDSAKDVERLQVLAANHAVDVIICPQREIMEAYAGYGYLRELPALLSKEAEDRAREEKRLIRAAGMLWTDEISFEDHESGQGPEKPYVMDISRTGRWERLAGTGTPGFLGTVLDTPHTSYCMALIDGRYLSHLYYGERIGRSDLTYLLRLHDYILPPSERPDEMATFWDRLPHEYPTEGRGDFRETCLGARNAGGLLSLEPVLTDWKIHREKKTIPGLPASFGDNAQTLEIDLTDKVSGLALQLFYTVFQDADVVVRSAAVRNGGKAPIYLNRALSACLSLPEGKGKTLTFGGAWAREHMPVWREAGYGGTISESRRGAPGHSGQPFMGFLYDQGGLYGMHLIYSGSYLAKLDMDSFGDYRMAVGIHPDTFEWKLEAGDIFYTPEAVLFYTPLGTEGMTGILHDFYRLHLIRNFKKNRPILINNWEATYFDFDKNRILSIAKEAAGLGVDTFVVDDGWFGKGRMQPSGDLGDWVPSKKKLPGGLRDLSAGLKALGLKLGLWFEPEMVSEDSDLFRVHPDWVLHQEGRAPAKCRDQWVLDLSNPQVREYLITSISAAIREGEVSYIKWDMNRMLSDAGSSFLPPDRQGEIWHRHILGVYEIQEQLLALFPNLIIENCASGGARFDPGMLYYSPQIWCSDNMDPVDRARIHEGTAMLYPLSAIGSHVSKSPGDITGRTSSFRTRGITAMFGCFGYELDITGLTGDEKSQISRQIDRYKELRPLFFEGDYYCLHPIGEKDRYQVLEIVSKDKQRGCIFFFQALSEANGRSLRVRLKGLSEDLCYEIRGKVYRGDALLKAGIFLPYVKQDFYAEIIAFKALPHPWT